jgi:MobA-like NTP transferase domain
LKPTLLVMAAGIGSRFGGDKQLEPVGPGGETLLDYSVFDAIRSGFGRVVFVIRRDMAERFHEAIGRRYEGRLEVAYAFQEIHDLPAGFSVTEGRTKPWGTGQAVLAAAPLVETPFAVINADDYYGADSFAQLGAFLSSPDRAERPQVYALVAFRLRDTVSEHGSVARGICAIGADGSLTKVTEVTGIDRAPDGGFRAPGPDGERRLTGDEPVSLNFWGFTPSLFGDLHERFRAFLRERGQKPGAEFFLPDAVNELMAGGRVSVKALHTRSSWFGLTYKADKPRLEERLREMAARGEYPAPLWS